MISNKNQTLNYPDLTPGNIYRVLCVEANDYRIINDEGKPYVFPAEIFEIVEKGGEDWETNYIEGQEYSYPKELSSPGFFEDYFDRDKKAIAIFDIYMNKLMGKYIGPIDVKEIQKKINSGNN